MRFSLRIKRFWHSSPVPGNKQDVASDGHTSASHGNNKVEEVNGTAPSSTDRRSSHEESNATTTESSVRKGKERATSKPPESNPKRKALLQIFKATVETLGKAPLPGIDLAASIIGRIIVGVEQWPDASSEWSELLEELERMTATLKLYNEQKALTKEELAKKGETEAHMKTIWFQPLYKELEALEKEIVAVNSKRIELAAFWRFWNLSSDINAATAFKQKLRDATQHIQICISIHVSRDLDALKAEMETFINEIRERVANDEPISNIIQFADQVEIGSVLETGKFQTVLGQQTLGVEQRARGIKIGTLSGSFQSVS